MSFIHCLNVHCADKPAEEPREDEKRSESPCPSTWDCSADGKSAWCRDNPDRRFTADYVTVGCESHCKRMMMDSVLEKLISDSLIRDRKSCSLISVTSKRRLFYESEVIFSLGKNHGLFTMIVLRTVELFREYLLQSDPSSSDSSSSIQGSLEISLMNIKDERSKKESTAMTCSMKKECFEFSEMFLHNWLLSLGVSKKDSFGWILDVKARSDGYASDHRSSADALKARRKSSVKMTTSRGRRYSKAMSMTQSSLDDLPDSPYLPYLDHSDFSQSFPSWIDFVLVKGLDCNIEVITEKRFTVKSKASSSALKRRRDSVSPLRTISLLPPLKITSVREGGLRRPMIRNCGRVGLWYFDRRKHYSDHCIQTETIRITEALRTVLHLTQPLLKENTKGKLATVWLHFPDGRQSKLDLVLYWTVDRSAPLTELMRSVKKDEEYSYYSQSCFTRWLSDSVNRSSDIVLMTNVPEDKASNAAGSLFLQQCSDLLRSTK